MSTPSDPLAVKIQEAANLLAVAGRLVCEPSARNVQLCCAVLGSVGAAIEAVRAESARHPAAARRLGGAVAALRTQIGVVAVLLQRAATYHTNLLEAMVDASRCATTGEQPPQLGRILVQA